jgi:hypothetical protein
MALALGVLIIPALALYSICISLGGSVGAALAKPILPFFGILIFARMLQQQYGVFWSGRSLNNVGLAGSLMLVSYAVLAPLEDLLLLSSPLCVGIYVGTLIGTRELRTQDLMAFRFWRNAK